MTNAMKSFARLIAVVMLTGTLVSCQTATSGQQAETPQTVAAEPTPPAAEPAATEPAAAEPVSPKPVQTVQQAAVEPAPTPAPIEQPQAADAAAAVEAEAELVFLDFAGFDEDLSREMNAERRIIAVDVPASFSLNNVPERLDRWFSRVKQTGGDVQAREKLSEEERRTRGIVGVLLDIAVSAFKAHEAEEMLRPAEDYNVLVEYDKQTGKANRVLFYQR